MIINHTHKFVFVHVPKSAGTAVSTMLRTLSTYRDLEIGTGPIGQKLQETYGKEFGLVKHSPAARIRGVMGEEDWNSYFTFGFARNPFARLQSIFHFLKTWDKLPRPERQNLAPFQTFEEFLEGGIWEQGYGPSGIYRPQCAWLTGHGQKNWGLIVDFVGRQETLADDMVRIAERISERSGHQITLETDRKANVTPSYRRQTEWTEDTIERVVKRYAVDFEVLNYPPRPEGF